MTWSSEATPPTFYTANKARTGARSIGQQSEVLTIYKEQGTPAAATAAAATAATTAARTTATIATPTTATVAVKIDGKI